MQILRRKQVCAKTGMSYSSIWRLERAGKFPSRIRLSVGIVGWRDTEIEDWLASREMV